MRNKFEKGNTYGSTSSRKGVPNRIKKEDCIQLVNMLLEDFTTNYDTLNQYQKIKIFGFMKDVLRDTMTPNEEQAGAFKIPEVIFLNRVDNEQKHT